MLRLPGNGFPFFHFLFFSHFFWKQDSSSIISFRYIEKTDVNSYILDLHFLRTRNTGKVVSKWSEVKSFSYNEDRCTTVRLEPSEIVCNWRTRNEKARIVPNCFKKNLVIMIPKMQKWTRPYQAQDFLYSYELISRLLGFGRIFYGNYHKIFLSQTSFFSYLSYKYIC